MMSNNLKNQKGIAFMPILIWSAIILIGGLVGQDVVKRGYISINIPLNVETNNVPAPIPSSIPVQTSEPTPTSTPAQAPVAKKILPTPDPDPIINCNFTYTGVKKIKRSECNKSFECEIADKWYVYTSHDKCKQDQDTYWKNYYATTGTTNTYTPPSNTNNNPNEITCSVIGYSKSRNVWTPMLTPEECDLARTNANPTSAPTPSYPPCTIFYPVLNTSSTYTYMSPEECKTAQDKLNSESAQNDSGSSQNYNSAVSGCLSRMRALGIASSSYSQQCYNNPNLGL